MLRFGFGFDVSYIDAQELNNASSSVISGCAEWARHKELTIQYQRVSFTRRYKRDET